MSESIKKIAAVFPGQGSQKVGMLDSIAHESSVRVLMQKADDSLASPLTRIIAQGPSETLNLTTNTQPALLLTSFALYSLFLEKGGKTPAIMAGHSLGEYTALLAAGALSFKEAISLVRFRAETMQSAIPVGVGGMVAIVGLAEEVVLDICKKTGAEAVNFNCPGQIVVAGKIETLRNAAQLAKQAGARLAVELPVSAPFHSSLLLPIVPKMLSRLLTINFKEPSVPVLSNVDVSFHTSKETICDKLSRQVASPVHWEKTVRVFEAQGVTDIIEFGPGRVLTGLCKRICPQMRLVNISDLASLQAYLSK